MLFTCLTIFLARICDVSLATLRTMIMVKKKSLLTPVLAFFEVLIWFIAARRALNTDINSFFIPVSYAFGYATGTLIGGFFARLIVKNYNRIEVITYHSKKVLNVLNQNNYASSLIKIENKDLKGQVKDLIIIDVKSKNTRETISLIKQADSNAYITSCDIKQVINGYIK